MNARQIIETAYQAGVDSGHDYDVYFQVKGRWYYTNVEGDQDAKRAMQKGVSKIVRSFGVDPTYRLADVNRGVRKAVTVLTNAPGAKPQWTHFGGPGRVSTTALATATRI